MNQIPSRNRIPPVVIAAAIVVLLAGMTHASSIISPLLLALFISIILSQPVQWLVRKSVPLWASIAIVIVVTGLLFFGMGQIIGRSFSSFSQNAPVYAEKLNAMSVTVMHFLQDQGIEVTRDQLGKLVEPGKIMNTTATIISQVGSLLGNTFLVFFIIIFILTEDQSFSLKAKALMGNKGDSIAFLNTIGKNIRHYLTIKTLVSLLTGVLIWIGLLILGVDYAIVWGLIAFLLNYIPTIGSILAGVPAVLLALVQLGFGGALWTLGIFLTVNVIVGSAIEPKMMGKGLGLSTLVVFIGLIFWGYILGIIGMFLSVPMTMALKIVLEQNQGTRWVAILLGSSKEAKILLEESEKKREEPIQQ